MGRGWLVGRAGTCVFPVMMAVFIGACSGGSKDPGDAGGMDATGGDAGGACTDHSDCDDGEFCNGAERCRPDDPDADGDGCVPAASSACMAGQTCDEATDACQTECDVAGDADGDGHDAVECGGDDCDDSDPNRFPGNTEVCDSTDHDEDCDPTTYGFRDLDMDGEADAACCNEDSSGERFCGLDCDDARPNVNTTTSEVCDGLDNDCDGMVDEGVLTTYTIDEDGDGYGSDADGAMTMEACTKPEGYAESADDCDDTEGSVHPAAPEICDDAEPPVDENCDGEANPTDFCSCEAGETRECGLPGACAAGIEACDADRGTWGPCSIEPETEECDGTVDEDCDGLVDEGLTVTCYEDGDNDGYAAAGAAASEECPVSTRDAVGGCPVGMTNRAPTGDDVDCNDGEASVSPAGSEVCTSGSAVDEDCDGMIDEGVTVTCWEDGDNDTWPKAGATDVAKCPDSTRGSVGGCPVSFTNRDPVDGEDCDDTESSVNPGAAEECDGSIDDDCDGDVDEGCDCAESETRNCEQPGQCADGTQDCQSDGTWSECSIQPESELCNAEDDDCDGSTDEAFDCIAGSSPVSCTVHDDDGDGTSDDGCTLAPGERECLGDCSLGPCVGDEICNGCDEDGDGVVDETFFCAQGDTTVDCTTACGTSGTGTCNTTCDGVEDCTATEECNYCDDDGDGTIHDENSLAESSDTLFAGCSATGIENITNALDSACVFDGDPDHSGGTVNPQSVLLHDSLALDVNIVVLDPEFRLGYDSVTIKILVRVRNQVASGGMPEAGWAVVLMQDGSFGLCSAADQLGYCRDQVDRGLAVEWRWNGDAADEVTVRRLDGSATGTVIGSAQEVDDSSQHFDSSDGTSLVLQQLYVRYTPELDTVADAQEKLEVRNCSFTTDGCSNLITHYGAGPPLHGPLTSELDAAAMLNLAVSAEGSSSSVPEAWWEVTELPVSTGGDGPARIDTDGLCGP